MYSKVMVNLTGIDMKLFYWLRENKRFIKHHEFAEKLGISLTYLSRIVNCKQSPSVRLAKRIQEITNGQVKWHEIIDQVSEEIEKNRSTK